MLTHPRFTSQMILWGSRKKTISAARFNAAIKQDRGPLPEKLRHHARRYLLLPAREIHQMFMSVILQRQRQSLLRRDSWLRCMTATVLLAVFVLPARLNTVQAQEKPAAEQAEVGKSL